MSELTNLIVFCEGVKTRLLHSSQRAELDNLMDRVQVERDDLLTDRKGLVRYVRALRALQKSLRDHGMDVSSAKNNAVWDEVILAYEGLSRELRDEISGGA